MGDVADYEIRSAISRKLQKTELMSQLITNRKKKAYMDFQHVQNSITLNDHESSKCIYDHQ